MINQIFSIQTTSGTWYICMPESLSYMDERSVVKINMWDGGTTNYDAGKTMQNITLNGFERDKQSLDWVDSAMDVGDAVTIDGFDNNDINGVYVIESFSYTRESPGGYMYSLQMERKI